MRPLRHALLILLSCSLALAVSPAQADPVEVGSVAPESTSGLADGHMVNPMAGDRLLDSVDLEWVAGSSDINTVEVTISGCPGRPWQINTLESGRTRGGANLSRCEPGEQTLTAYGVRYGSAGREVLGQESFPVTILGTGTQVAFLRDPERPQPIVTRSSPESTSAAEWVIRSRAATRRATVRYRILDGDGEAVRHLVRSLSESDDWGYLRGTWDGRDDAGELVADGSYEVVAEITDAEGEVATDRREVLVDLRDPASLISPAVVRELSGKASLEWDVDPWMDVRSIYASLPASSGCRGPAELEPRGSARWAIDVGSCWSGPRDLTWTVSWVDRFGQRHTYRGETPVRVRDETAPRLTRTEKLPVVVAPDRPGGLANGNWSFACTDQSLTEVVTVLTDWSGRVVREIPGPDPSTCQNSGWITVSWDGNDEAGEEVMNGVYSATSTATDATGSSSSISVEVRKDNRPPAGLTGIRAGDRLNADDLLVWTPREYATVFGVSAHLSGPCASYRSLPQDQEGRFVLGDLGGESCLGREATLRWWVFWMDAGGRYRIYEDSLDLTGEDNTPPVLNASAAADQILAPSGPDRLGPVQWNVEFSDASPISYEVVIRDAKGRLVRRWSAVKVPRDQVAFTPEWDGTDAKGRTVADGRYRVTVRATDAGGLRSTARFRVTVDSRIPGQLEGVEDGDQVEPGQTVRFVPDPGFSGAIAQVGVVTASRTFFADRTTTSAAADGSWALTVPAETRTGRNTLTWSVTWADDRGASHTFQSAPITVTVARDRPVAVIEASELQDGTVNGALLSVEVFDPDEDLPDPNCTRTVDIAWGDGKSETYGYCAPYYPFRATHQYAEPGRYVITVKLADVVGPDSTEVQTSVTVGPYATAEPTAEPTSAPKPTSAPTGDPTPTEASGQ